MRPSAHTQFSLRLTGWMITRWDTTCWKGLFQIPDHLLLSYLFEQAKHPCLSFPTCKIEIILKAVGMLRKITLLGCVLWILWIFVLNGEGCGMVDRQALLCSESKAPKARQGSILLFLIPRWLPAGCFSWLSYNAGRVYLGEAQTGFWNPKLQDTRTRCWGW